VTQSLETPNTSDQRRCGCCGRRLPAADLAELGQTPGVFICTGCALWAACRAGLISAIRRVPLRSLLRRFGRHHDESMIRSAIPILPSTDLDRTTAFYSAVGFHESERFDGYLLLHSGDVELHFSWHDDPAPGGCFLHVADAMKLWNQLSDQGTTGVGPIAEQSYGLREFVLTDPDGNRIRIGSRFVV
jgi:catechol 2,3-dioxygenase-like lactoylglutathione lyase family enzyme